jgi:hypothetical protein
MHYDNAIHIKGGRHILYERVTENYVSNDTTLFGGGDATVSPAEANGERLGSIVSTTNLGFRWKFDLIFRISDDDHGG